MNIIGFTGKMGSGKSTAIQILGETQKTNLIKFAQPLYDMQEMIYARISGTYDRPTDFVKDRKLLQWLGTEWGRGTIRDTLWVDIWADAAYAARQNNGYPVVCDDVRFDNEATAVKALGGVVVEIVSDFNSARINTGAGISSHSSERGISPDLVDFVVRNDGTVDDLRHALHHILREVACK